MIFYWLDRLGGWIIWLFKKPTDVQVARLNPNLKCPGCGHENGELRCVEKYTKTLQPVLMMQHRCKVCGGKCYEQPVGKVDLSFMDPCEPRNEIEKDEDRLQKLAVMSGVRN